MIARLGYQGALDDCRQLADQLAQTGLGPDACRQKAELLAKAAAALQAHTAGRQSAGWGAFFVPGRIEVLGKHTDYAGGQSIIAAAERGFCVVVAPREDEQIGLSDAASGQSAAFRLDPELTPRSEHWSNYPMTVARRIARNFPAARRGASIAFASDLPPAAGMSSSSAMLVAMFLALEHVNQLSADGQYQHNVRSLTDLAGYLAAVENGQSFGSLAGDRGVGTFGGSEDHTAILCARPNQLSQYAYCPVRFQHAIPLPAGCTFAIGASGVAAEKTGAAREKYNRASRLAAAIVGAWCRQTGRNDPHLAAALASSPEAAGQLAQIIQTAPFGQFAPDALLARLEHFFTENEQLVPAAGDALLRGDLGTFAELVDRSQQAAEELLGNQVAQTSYLAASARTHGALAASAFGAGFGGSVWAMVKAADAGSFLSAWAAAYRARFPQNVPSCSFFVTGAGPAAFQVC